MPDDLVQQRIARDARLAPHAAVIERRIESYQRLRRRLTGKSHSLTTFASGHERLGVLRDDDGWVVREWAPHAKAVWLKGSFSDWRCRSAFLLDRGPGGVWELRLPPNALEHGMEHRLALEWPGGRGDRIPAYARRVVQNETTGSWNAEIHDPARPFEFRNALPGPVDGPLFVYEAHIGMAQEAERVGTFDEFRTEVLPRVRDAGYDTLQLMGLAEHAYYASFGYQITSYFAPSSRFGTADDLKALVDDAHGMGIRVLMDLVHSHCARNTVEGISRQDGSERQYVHAGPRGEHAAWGSRCFDYGRPRVLEFLLSNCRYWLTEFAVDGFRFDGVTSMLYTHHGLGKTFQSYREYFDDRVDEDALLYLTLANDLVHEVRPEAVTIAEDVSGMPGLAAAIDAGGAGFDYRFAMGVADEWTRLVKEVPDEKWPMDKLWYELTNRRRDEKSIGYAESHDQAMVGDQTLLFRLVGERMYDRMSILRQDVAVDRGIALHKLIRLVTLATAGDGYLNFMGNEFGHPEWIDFPREGNEGSFAHARRQWSLRDDDLLRYGHLAEFDREMLDLAHEHGVPDGDDEYLLLNDTKAKVLAFLRCDLVFVFNFHPQRSFVQHEIPAAPGTYRVVFDTDLERFGGHDRQDPNVSHETFTDRIHRHFLRLYLPARTALVLRAVATAE